MLARSKTAPVDFHHYSLDYGEGLVAQHFFHLRHLSLSGYARDLKRVVRSLRPPANVLESLTMSSQGELALSTDALSGPFPRLNRVILANVVVPWSSSIFCSGNLTQLRIVFLRGMHAESEAQPGPALDGSSPHGQLLDALQKMPRLEQLFLQNCLPVPPRTVAGAPVRTVGLPCLKKLLLTDGALECSGLVRWIKVSPPCTVSLLCNRGAAHIMDVVSFLIAHANAGSGLPPFYKLVAETNIDVVGSVSIQTWRRPDTLPTYPQSAFDVGGSPDLEIQFPRDMQSLHPLETLCRALPLDGLGVLVHSKMFPWPAWSPQEWIDLFGRCNSLTHVSISGNDTASFSEALAVSMTAHETSSLEPGMTAPTLEPLFFKNLETLRLEHCGHPIGFGVVMPVMGGEGLFYDKLLEWLTMRKETRPYPAIDIRRCSVTKEQIEELKKVAWVTWDGESGDEIQDDDFDEVETEVETEIADDDEESVIFSSLVFVWTLTNSYV
ncbi:hypothetical protein EWM64_g5611 [Hericium alpestre]|uniref:F-box domain-containing protein n=1 Tax=Hericium alpestre TaxID=135208 RepID=A0A4Y9ZW41_9AGAM|nr:hypothetical protein EWM64_g5611 [Hericium alpestre]